MAASVAASLVFAYVCPPVTPPMRQTAHHRSCIVLNEGYEEAVSQADPNFPRPRRSGLKYSVTDAPRTLEASELHAQLHGTRPTGRAADDPQSEAFERGVLLGFALAQHLPAMPIPPDELLSPPEAKKGLSPCTIKVVGVGGGGGNTLNRMVEDGPGVERSTFLEYIAANTDVQALSASLADTTVQLGKNQARPRPCG